MQQLKIGVGEDAVIAHVVRLGIKGRSHIP
jgi:hypothetical protein